MMQLSCNSEDCFQGMSHPLKCRIKEHQNGHKAFQLLFIENIFFSNFIFKNCFKILQ